MEGNGAACGCQNCLLHQLSAIQSNTHVASSRAANKVHASASAPATAKPLQQLRVRGSTACAAAATASRAAAAAAAGYVNAACVTAAAAAAALGWRLRQLRLRDPVRCQSLLVNLLTRLQGESNKSTGCASRHRRQLREAQSSGKVTTHYVPQLATVPKPKQPPTCALKALLTAVAAATPQPTCQCRAVRASASRAASSCSSVSRCCRASSRSCASTPRVRLAAASTRCTAWHRFTLLGDTAG